MKQIIGQKFNVRVKIENKILFYTAVITGISNTHIFFIDKYGKQFMFLLTDIVELSDPE